MNMNLNEKLITERELLNAIKDILKKNGYLNRLTTEMRSQITEILRARQASSDTEDKVSEPPEPTPEVLLVNELIREYLEWNGYLYTVSVMNSEAALPKEKKKRADLCMDVGVKDDAKSSALPLLSNIVAAYTDRIRRKINKSKREGYLPVS